MPIRAGKAQDKEFAIRIIIKAARRPINRSQPVRGEAAFVHESGIHCHAMLRDRRTYEPFDPARVGQAGSRFVIGQHSGTAAVRDLLRKAGIDAAPWQARALKPLLLKTLTVTPECVGPQNCVKMKPPTKRLKEILSI